MPDTNLIIYCDESTSKGRYYSHFYGGALIRAEDREYIEASLSAVKAENNLGAEMKWTKITDAYKNKYKAFIDCFFDLVAGNKIKLRIMFTQNSNKPIGLEDHQINNEYWLLYYKLIKHAFGLMHCGQRNYSTRVSIFLDDVPDNRANFDIFRNYVSSLTSNPLFVRQKVHIPKEEIVDVDSKAHLILQGLDVVLGSMQFRLNDLYLEKPQGKRVRSKRTRAKEEVYNHINMRVRQIYTNFNIGVSTATKGDVSNRWHHPCRHWLFVPSETEAISGAGKPRNRQAP